MYRVSRMTKEGWEVYPEYLETADEAAAKVAELGEDWEAKKVDPSSEKDQPPMALVALSQGLVNNLWMEARYWRARALKAGAA